MKIANVYELRGIDQTAPLEASAGSAGGDCSTDDPNDGINTATANDFIVSGVATLGSGPRRAKRQASSATRGVHESSGLARLQVGLRTERQHGHAHHRLEHVEL